jgi:hypothetical protein
LLSWLDVETDNIKHAHSDRFLEIDRLRHNHPIGQQLLDLDPASTSCDIECPLLEIDIGDRAHFNTEPIQVTVELPPVSSSLEIKLSFDDAYHLPFLVSTTPTGLLAYSLPPTLCCNICILVIGAHDPVTIPEVLEAFRSRQVRNAVAQVNLWIVKRNNRPRTDIEEQRTMFDRVRYAPVSKEPAIAPMVWHAVTSLNKPDCTEHVGKMVRSPFKKDFKFAHFKNYNKMYQTGTWGYPVARSLLPSDAIILPIRSTYAVKSTETASLWELQVRSCDNGACMIEGLHFYNSYAHVAMMDSIHVVLALGATQGNQVLSLDINNTFQNTIEFYPRNVLTT